jgi:hypothetical protein
MVGGETTDRIPASISIGLKGATTGLKDAT